jgi:hypothetical protein
VYRRDDVHRRRQPGGGELPVEGDVVAADEQRDDHVRPGRLQVVDDRAEIGDAKDLFGRVTPFTGVTRTFTVGS